MLLLKCLKWLWRDRNDFYAAGNLTIYYSQNKGKTEDFQGPDFFVVLDTERKTRKSWVVWEEDGKYPHVILEILALLNLGMNCHSERNEVKRRISVDATLREAFRLHFASLHSA